MMNFKVFRNTIGDYLINIHILPIPIYVVQRNIKVKLVSNLKDLKPASFLFFLFLKDYFTISIVGGIQDLSRMASFPQ